MTKKMNCTLWAVQILLALLYLFAGGLKLILPVAELTKQLPLPGAFLRLIGASEVLGAAGLILPGLVRRRWELTPVAAVGLSIIMLGATVLLIANPGADSPLMPMALGLLDGMVAWGRWDDLKQNWRGTCWSPSQP
jgi:uncharacterized membrane protein YphA (DoxX/SURF4 family)